MPEMQQRLLSDWMRRLWSKWNDQAFQGRLNLPVFGISHNARTLGSWQRDTRTLSLSLELLTRHSLLEVEETLKHEMAHQYADEVLGGHAAGETPHGSAFRHACAALGIHHNARFRPSGQPSPLLRRIQKLLALSESHNAHEAEAAMAKARELMDKYELDLGVAESDFGYAFFGQPRKQKSMRDQLIASVLVRFFHVELVWVPSHPVLDPQRTLWLMEVNGTPANLEIAEYVHDFLRREVELLWREHRRRRPWEKGRSAKRDFQVGVLKGLIDKLGRAGSPPPGAKRELMLLRQEKLRVFFHQRHPNLRSGRRMSYRETAAFHAGFERGRELEIRRGLKEQRAQALGGPKRIGSGKGD